jgi:hypothetical protein
MLMKLKPVQHPARGHIRPAEHPSVAREQFFLC